MQVTVRNRRQREGGYPWIFANQVERVDGGPATGDVVRIVEASGNALGQGFFHASSLIAVRFLTSDMACEIGADFFRMRLSKAVRARALLYPDATHVRLLYGESDGLPGCIVDRYQDVITWSTLCAGMDLRREMLLDILEVLVSPTAVVERNDNPLRTKDGLGESTGVIRGAYAGPIEIVEAGVRYLVDVMNGPKTGFFIDQRENRAFVRRLARGMRVLDVFCNDGGFGLQALAGGATSVHAIDVSAVALTRLTENANLNGLLNGLRLENAEALEKLVVLEQSGSRYDLVILDPPAFAKSRRHIESATRSYQLININGLKLLDPGGYLATSSCSQAIGETDFLRIVRYSARKAGCRLRLIYRGSQPPDHPVLESMPETAYLKFYVFQKLSDELPAA